MNDADPRLGGSMVLQHRRVWNELLSVDRVDACLKTLAPKPRADLENATALSWVPFSSLEAAYAPLAAEVGESIPVLHSNVVRIGVERNAKTVWRILLRVTTDTAIWRRAPILFSKGYDRGKVEAEVTGPGAARMTVTEFRGMNPFIARGLGVAAESLLSVAGRRDPRAAVKPTTDGAVVHISWTK
ncbi:MAG: hypothetical protein AAGF12_37745 [Myxococcota bacterium]